MTWRDRFAPIISNVIDSFDAKEVARKLAKGGRFIMNTPPEVIHDWLIDQGREKDAEEVARLLEGVDLYRVRKALRDTWRRCGLGGVSHPYKIWCSEVNRQLTAKGWLEPKAKDDAESPLFQTQESQP